MVVNSYLHIEFQLKRLPQLHKVLRGFCTDDPSGVKTASMINLCNNFYRSKRKKITSYCSYLFLPAAPGHRHATNNAAKDRRLSAASPDRVYASDPA